MTTPKSRMLVRAIACAALLQGCARDSTGQKPREATSEEQMKITIKTAEAAQEEVARQFNLIFTPLQIRNPLDQNYYPISPLTAAEFKVVEEDDHTWTLLRENLSGPRVRAKIGKMTGLVQFEPLELTVE